MTAFGDAGGIEDLAAISIAAQQHGMVCLEENGTVVRDALLWNDTRSAHASLELIDDLGGPKAWADAVGSVPIASFTVAKLRWLRNAEPDAADRTAAVCLPHDWLTWRLGGRGRLVDLRTDRSDASGTGYWSPAEEGYRNDLLELALGQSAQVPTVLGPAEAAGTTPSGTLIAAGAGDNAAAALGLDIGRGDVIVSIGTSGVACARSPGPSADPSGEVAGFASATGDHLPLVCTLNAARVIDAVAGLLRVSHEELSDLAVRAPAGANGVVLIPYFEGERTPNRPDATAALHGLQLANSTPEDLARAAFEGLLCGLADGIDALEAVGVQADRVILIGGGARAAALSSIAPAVLGRPVVIPTPGEYVADGAARQAGWALRGELPTWELEHHRSYEAAPTPFVRAQYAEVRDLTASRRQRS